jgi:UDP-N-acetylglucosamine 2-epimerase (non-hydrolysing)
VKLNIPVAHIEAGMRSYDRTMPEEINRVIVDCISTYLFPPSPDGKDNLIAEGVSESKIHVCGDTMVDNLLYNLEKSKLSNITERLSLTEKLKSTYRDSVMPYCLLTLHRVNNVDDASTLEKIVIGLQKITSKAHIIFPIHPRTKERIFKFGLQDYFCFHGDTIKPIDFLEGYKKKTIHCINPLPYHDFVYLMMNATAVLTDSGGIQQEATILDIPCLILRETTERPMNLINGTNVLTYNNSNKIKDEFNKIWHSNFKHATRMEYDDGHAAERIVDVLTNGYL